MQWSVVVTALPETKIKNPWTTQKLKDVSVESKWWVSEWSLASLIFQKNIIVGQQQRLGGCCGAAHWAQPLRRCSLQAGTIEWLADTAVSASAEIQVHLLGGRKMFCITNVFLTGTFNQIIHWNHDFNFFYHICTSNRKWELTVRPWTPYKP